VRDFVATIYHALGYDESTTVVIPPVAATRWSRDSQSLLCSENRDDREMV
jgi:hypothetical protein